MSHGYTVIYDIIGEVMSRDKETGVFVWELRPEIKRWKILDPSSSSLTPFDQPPLYDVARWFEEFWTSGEPMPVTNGLYAGSGRRIEVLRVTLVPGKLQVTMRPLEIEM